MMRSGSPSNSPDISAIPAALSATAQRVLGDDHAGRRQHAHTGEGHHVEGELDVAVAEPDTDTHCERIPMIS